MTWTAAASWIAVFMGLLAAWFWLWSALVRVPDHVETIANEPGSILWIIRRQSSLSAFGAVFAAISVLAQAVVVVLRAY